MRVFCRTFGIQSGIFGLLLLAAMPLLAGGPGKGDFAKRPGGGLASLEAKFNLSQLMGEPLVACTFKWEAEVGYQEDLPSDTVLWLKVRSGEATAFIRCSPIFKDSGKGFGMDSPGSPNWKDVLVLEWSGNKAIRTMDEKAAKAFWKAGFNVVDLQLSGPPARQGDQVPARKDGKFVSNGKSEAGQGTLQAGAGMATGGPEKPGPGTAAVAGVATGLSASVPVKLQPNPVSSRTAPLVPAPIRLVPSPESAAQAREAEERAARAAELQRRREEEEARRRARQMEHAAQGSQEAKEKAARVAELQRRSEAEEADRQARQAARGNQQTREADEKAARLAELQRQREAEEAARLAREAARRRALEEQRKKDQEAADAAAAAARKKK